MSDRPPDTVVLSPAYWCEHSSQLARLLAAPSGPPPRIPDPGGQGTPGNELAVHDPAYWGQHPQELHNALLRSIEPEGRPNKGHGGVGAAPSGQERLTFTVEEAATMLGISRAFAYEAVGRGEIPHIRIGRRILVPRSALDRLLSGEAT